MKKSRGLLRKNSLFSFQCNIFFLWFLLCDLWYFIIHHAPCCLLEEPEKNPWGTRDQGPSPLTPPWSAGFLRKGSSERLQTTNSKGFWHERQDKKERCYSGVPFCVTEPKRQLAAGWWESVQSTEERVVTEKSLVAA